MNRVLRALSIILCFEMGALLLYLPWTEFLGTKLFSKPLSFAVCRCCCILLCEASLAASGCWIFFWLLV